MPLNPPSLLPRGALFQEGATVPKERCPPSVPLAQKLGTTGQGKNTEFHVSPIWLHSRVT